MASTDTEARGNSFDLDKPAPRPAAEREAALARYAIKGFKSCDGMDGTAWSLTLVRDGKAVAKVNNEGCGGEVSWHGLTDKDYYLRAGGLIDEIEADAVAWFVGSKADEVDYDFMDGSLPRGCRDILVEELMRREDERKWLVGQTRGGRRVLFQVDGDIGTDRWRQFPLREENLHHGSLLAPDHVPEAVEAAKGKGARVRVAWRDGKDLKVEIFRK